MKPAKLLVSGLLALSILNGCSGGSDAPSPAHNNVSAPVLIEGAYYVAAGGTATWSESQNNPDNPTSYDIAMTNATAGDTVYFRGGNYLPEYTGTDAYIPAMYPVNDGTSTQPITFIAYPGETPTLIANNTNDAATFGCYNNSYIIWDGFSAQMADTSAGYNTSWLAVLQSSDNCQIKNSYLAGVTQGTPSSGGNAAPIRIEVCSHCSVTYNEINGNLGSTSSVNVTGIWIFNSSDTIIANNHIHHCSNGIMQKTGTNQRPWIHHNFIHDIDVIAIHLNETVGNSLDGILDNNVIVNSDLGIFIEGSGGSAFMSNYTVSNNTIAECRTGIQFSTNAPNGSAHDNVIYSCTVPVRYYTAAPLTADYNCYDSFTNFDLNYTTPYATLADWQTVTGGDANSVHQNPLFDGTHGTTPASYALLPASPCINSSTGLVMGAQTNTVGN